ncbi:MAG: protein kinase [Candidatus Obscuribacter sp.]|nr:protein kinase [Candidatus Obscuribacter sp.]
MDQRSEQARSQLFTVKLDKNAVYMLAEQDQALHSAQQRPQPRSALQSRQAPPARRNLSVNQVIDGKYRILEPIGQGGMGAVFRVFHIQLDKEVALKTFVTDALTEEAWLRFQREAQAIARLNHLNVVKVFDFGVDSDGVPYYTMELLRGRSLAQVIDEEGGFDQKRTISTFIMVARGLAAAHSRGIIHRDIKPGNILLMEDNSGRYEESVKLVDFGIATLVSDSDNVAPQGESGVIFGSPLYMSPEQFRGDKLTPGTDLYSFGCTLFEALTTKPPFFGANAIETMSMHLNAAPPTLDSALPAMDVPQRLERLLGSLLAKDVQDRPADFSVVERELLAVLERLEATAALASKASIKRLATAAPIDDEHDDGETRAELLPHSFWKRSVISTIALSSLLILGIAGGAAVLQKPLKALLSGGSKNARVSQLQSGASEVVSDDVLATSTGEAPPIKPSSVDNSIEKGTFEFATDRMEGVIAAVEKTPTESAALIAKLRSTAPGSFDQTSDIDRQSHQRHFNFPPGVNLGEFLIKVGNGKQEKIVAKGDVLLPNKVWFKPNKLVAACPEVLNGFKNDSINAVSTDENCLLNDKHMRIITRWRQLGGMDLDARLVTRGSLPDLKNLKKLNSFGLAYIPVPADELGRAYDLTNMKVINISGVKNVRQLLLNLGPRFNPKVFYLQNCQLNDDDLKLLSKNTALEEVSVRDNPKITDVGVRALLTCKRLKKIELPGTSVTPAVAEILAGFEYLTNAVVNTRIWNEEQRQMFDAKLPTRINLADH